MSELSRRLAEIARAEAEQRTKPTTRKAEGAAVRLVTVRADEVKPEPVQWLWPGRIPRGMLSEICGDPGSGKSTLAIGIAAFLSRGHELPPGKTLDGKPVNSLDGKPVNSLILAGEDAIAQTIRPRLAATHAELSRVHILHSIQCGNAELPLILPEHFHLVQECIIRNKIGLVIVDPLNSFLSSDVNADRDKDVRSQVLYPLRGIAERTGAAILSVRHLNKGNGKAAYRAGGSIAFSAAARVSLFAGEMPDGRRYLVPNKSNAGKMPRAIEYSILSDDKHQCGVAIFGEESDLSADELLSVPAPESRSHKSDAAADWLASQLASGPKSVEELKASAEQAGFSWRTVGRAREVIGAVATRGAFSGKGIWQLPELA